MATFGKEVRNVGKGTGFPRTAALLVGGNLQPPSGFWLEWKALMNDCCHQHPVWNDSFMRLLNASDTSEVLRFALASVWSVNMVIGSYCFPRYVAALAARAEQDAVRHGLLENAWDESGSNHHTSRSHFWLAVKLARLLGLSDAEIERMRPLPDAQTYTDDHYHHCADGEFGFALGMICLIEEFTTPEFTAIFKAFLRSCKEGMGTEPDEFLLRGGAEYFTANISDDERHRCDMPRVVAVWLSSNGADLDDRDSVLAGLDRVRAGARHSADLRQQFFVGIYDFVKNGGSLRELIAN